MTEDLPSPALLPSGLTDLLPPEAAREAALVEAMHAVFAGHGYERVKPPLLEFEDSLLAGSGAAMAEQTFRLMDPDSHRMLGLRADTTPQVARIAATRLNGVARPLRLSYSGQVLRVRATRLNGVARPLRLSYSGQVLRVRGTQLAPERQIPQVGIELIGPDTAAADAEVALLGVEALAAVGIPAPSLDITLPTMAPALLDAAGVQGSLRRRLAFALDRKDAAAVTALAAEAGPPANGLVALLAAAGPADGALAALAGAQLPPAARAIADNAAAIVAAIRARAPGLRITLDPVEFRGLQYHVGVAFTLYGPGNTGELARGGRYRSGEEAATGMTLYPDAVGRAVPARPSPPRVFLPPGADTAVAAVLRGQGFVTVAALAATDTPQRLRCSHILRGAIAAPIEENA